MLPPRHALTTNFERDANNIPYDPCIHSSITEGLRKTFVALMTDYNKNARIAQSRSDTISMILNLSEPDKMSHSMFQMKLPAQLTQDTSILKESHVILMEVNEVIVRNTLRIKKADMEAAERLISEAALKAELISRSAFLREGIAENTTNPTEQEYLKQLWKGLEMTHQHALLTALSLRRQAKVRKPIIGTTDVYHCVGIEGSSSTGKTKGCDNGRDFQDIENDAKVKGHGEAKSNTKSRRQRKKASQRRTSAAGSDRKPAEETGNGTETTAIAAAKEIIDLCIDNKFTSVNNLTRIHPPALISSLLGKGLNYVPKLRIDEHEIRTEFQSVIHQIVYKLNSRECYSFAQSVQEWSPFFTKELINSCREYIKEDSEEQLIKELRRFQMEHDLVCIPADKNLGMTIIDRERYHRAVQSHLADSTTYRNEVPDWDRVKRSLIIVCKKYGGRGGLHSDFRKYWNDQHKPASFMMMPKLHKRYNITLNSPNLGTKEVDPLQYRPIVGCSNAATTKASKFLTAKLGYLQKSISWLMQDSRDAVRFLENTALPEHNAGIVTVDVVSLYTNIDPERGIASFRRMLLRSNVEHIEFYTELLRWVLNNNYFTYGGKWYLQIKGTAMGTNVAPLYANLYLADLELLWQEQNRLPSFYLRYLDDLIVVVDEMGEDRQHPNKHQDQFLRMLEGCEAAQFTYEVCGHTGVFLDIEVTAPVINSRRGRLHLKPYKKAMNKGLYTHPSTYQPRSQKLSWIGGEMIRMLRLSSTEEDWLKAINEFTISLLRRGYSKDIIKRYSIYSYDDRIRYQLTGTKRHQEIRIFGVTSNIPGRHILHNTVNRLINTCKVLDDNRIEDIPLISLAIKKGTNLFDITRKINQTLSLCLSRPLRN